MLVSSWNNSILISVIFWADDPEYDQVQNEADDEDHRQPAKDARRRDLAPKLADRALTLLAADHDLEAAVEHRLGEIEDLVASGGDRGEP